MLYPVTDRPAAVVLAAQVTVTLAPETEVVGRAPWATASALAAPKPLLTELQKALAAGPPQETRRIPRTITRARFQAPIVTRVEDDEAADWRSGLTSVPPA